ncbi:MAG TPA: hypothetical protein VH040_08900 [Usitatibacter sp.]|jgi:hypothetical protein|nr:hypothetical protein [Usitatibacter sp.]
MPFDLLVPDLLLPPDAPDSLRSLRLASLERWLARADVVREPPASAYAWLAQRYGLADPAPFAAISLAGEGIDNPGEWMRCDPVHLRIENDSIRLHDAAILDIQRDEAEALAASLRDHFAGDRLEIVVAAPDRWYARTPGSALPRTTPLEAAVGRNVFGLLPANPPGGFNWRSAMTEAQMLMSEHPVNVERGAHGKPAINSVWFWGEGPTPKELARPYAAIVMDDAFVKGLGTLSGAQTFAALRMGDEPRAADGLLVAIQALVRPLRQGNADEWTRVARHLDRTMFSEIGSALGRFDVVRLVLPSAKGTLVATLTPAARWRWLRPRRPLAAHA